MAHDTHAVTGCMLAAILFALGLVGLLVRRNLIFMLMSVEIMLNAAGLASSSPARAGDSRTARSCSCSFWRWRRRRCPWDWRWCCSSITSFKSLDADAASEMRG